ncbi:acetyltransferase [Dyella jiangningensis]|nr:acetyltransferase [Dyella jiangningensis]
MRHALVIRRASGADMPALLALVAEHAAFEQLPERASRRPGSLTDALDHDPPSLHAWIAQIDHAVVGYASATRDFSTFDAAFYLHMDCLYVREGWRGHGIGLRLWETVAAFARAHGCAAVQWQTPWWNRDASRFYRRLGAVEAAKLRYGFSLEDT